MARTAKIAISVDVEVLDALEALRARTGETRSAAIARAIRTLTQSAEHRGKVEAYREAYRQHPEAPADVKLAREVAHRALRDVAWDADGSGE